MLALLKRWNYVILNQARESTSKTFHSEPSISFCVFKAAEENGNRQHNSFLMYTR